MIPFWYSWPSWLVELLGGSVLGLCLGVIGLAFDSLLLSAIVALALSVWYELFIDVNQWSWKDVGQRTVGVAVGLAGAWWMFQ